ncbi:Protein CBG26992 [Caenorhabditis briggsae]|uniref:Protein CBG26992 n=1 Tax=Caenorhabditis briggsae TaxID=6238 RepID=B6IEV8_CAEBR|nr:Protein CBG26992 [Caenorhabditis briggsae]CAR98438.1 Protein CBG26992 [Caenorhabditis briggsae]
MSEPMKKKTQHSSFLSASSVTLVLFVVPVNSIILSVYTGYQNQILNNFIFLAFASHGIASTVIMVVVHNPYRRFLRSLSLQSSRKFTIMVINSEIRFRTT